MDEKTVRKNDNGSEVLDYSDLPPEIDDVVSEGIADVTEKEANISYDGRQYLFRFPKDIAKAMGIQKGDKVNIKVTISSMKVGGKKEIVFKFLRKNVETVHEQREEGH